MFVACPSCQNAMLVTQPCPHCGGPAQDGGADYVALVEAAPAEPLWVEADPSKPAPVARKLDAPAARPAAPPVAVCSGCGGPKHPAEPCFLCGGPADGNRVGGRKLKDFVPGDNAVDWTRRGVLALVIGGGGAAVRFGLRRFLKNGPSDRRSGPR